MAKKKRLKRRVKKLLKKSILIVLIICGGLISYQYLAPRMKLNQLGYQKEEIKMIMTLSSDEVDTLIDLPKIEKLTTWMALSPQLERYPYYMHNDTFYETLKEEEIVQITDLVFDHPEVFVFSKGQDKQAFFKKVTPEMINDYYEKQKETQFITDVDDKTFLVNRNHPLSMSFEPADLEECAIESAKDTTRYLAKEANEALKEMADAAIKEGYELMNNSSYRSYFDQVEIYQRYLDLYGKSYCDKYVATPGYSEHQSGLAIDLTSRSVEDGTYFVFGESPDYDWVKENAHKYGFVLRFASDKTDITKVANEPWHFRYVGKELSKTLYENNWCLEEYEASKEG